MSRWILSVAVLLPSLAKAQEPAALLTELREGSVAAGRTRLAERARSYHEALAAGDWSGLATLTVGRSQGLAALISRCQDALRPIRDQDAALPLLLWLLAESRDEAAATAACGRLLPMAKGPQARAFVTGTALRDSPAGREHKLALLAAVIRGNPDDGIKARAHLLRYQLWTDREADRRARDRQRVLALAPDSELVFRLDAPGLAVASLEIGDRAPDIMGLDLDGVPFRLSDYLGKVVVIDFWGDW